MICYLYQYFVHQIVVDDAAYMITKAIIGHLIETRSMSCRTHTYNCDVAVAMYWKAFLIALSY